MTTTAIKTKLETMQTWCSGYAQDVKIEHGGDYISCRFYSCEDDDAYDPDWDEREHNLESSMDEILGELNRYLYPEATASWYYCDSTTNRWGVHIDACIQIHNNNN